MTCVDFSFCSVVTDLSAMVYKAGQIQKQQSKIVVDNIAVKA